MLDLGVPIAYSTFPMGQFSALRSGISTVSAASSNPLSNQGRRLNPQNRLP